jgi:hypothetical protein
MKENRIIERKRRDKRIEETEEGIVKPLETQECCDFVEISKD